MSTLEREVPAGVPPAMKAKVAAKVLNFDERQLVKWCRSGGIGGFQKPPRKGYTWWIPAAEVARLAEEMMTEPDWEKAL